MLNRFFGWSEPVRFFLVAIYNIIIWYIIFTIINAWLGDRIWLLIILFFSYIIGAFHSFLTYKYLVFRSKGNFFKECYKTYVCYTYVYLINAVILFLLVYLGNMNIYFAQAICFVIVIISDYFLLKYITFIFHKKNKKQEIEDF